MHDAKSMDSRTRAAAELAAVAEHLRATMFSCGARVRVEIIAHLICGPMSVNELAAVLSLDNTLVSKSLRALREAGAVRMRKSKKNHIFSMVEQVAFRCVGRHVEIRLPVDGGLGVTWTIPYQMLRDLHPNAEFLESDAESSSARERVQSAEHNHAPPAQVAVRDSAVERIITRPGLPRTRRPGER